jgi:hypothetical protein
MWKFQKKIPLKPKIKQPVMKKIAMVIVILVLGSLAMSSCKSKELCPAYGTSQIEVENPKTQV